MGYRIPGGTGSNNSIHGGWGLHLSNNPADQFEQLDDVSLPWKWPNPSIAYGYVRMDSLGEFQIFDRKTIKIIRLENGAIIY